MEKYIFSKQLSNYLQEQGFIPVRTEPNFKKPKFICWVYESTSNLEESISKYLQSRKSF